MERKRDQIETKYKWKLEDIYASNAEWETEYSELCAEIPKLEQLRSTLTNSASSMLSGLKKLNSASHKLERLYVYARMHRDEDNTKDEYKALADRATSLSVRLSSATSWVSPMLLECPNLETFAQSRELYEYEFELKELLRSKQHVLSEKEEKLLSLAGNFSGGAKNTFTMLNNADLTFKSVKSGEEELPLSHATYIDLLQNRDRDIRKQAFENYYDSFKSMINTIAETYGTSVKKDVFYTQARDYQSALDRALFSDNVPQEVYRNLISCVHSNLSVLHSYVELRKQILGYDELHMYDIFAPLVDEIDVRYTYEEAVQMVKDSLKPLGEDYCKVLDTAFTDGWIDVYATKAKTSGAYSWGVYGVHPYVLLNHRGDLNSVFTLALELGHAMHTYYSNKNQPYPTSGYTIFCAEVASTVNEILLTKHLLKTVDDKKLKAYILNHYIDQFRTTVLRQTMFAEFELATHEMAENDEPMTPDSLCKLYGELNKKYHGPSMSECDDISYEWARIPHFYNAFYVYKYATGFSCAASIVENLDKPGMLDAYKNFLSSGGSDHTIALLERAGVNFDVVVDECMREFARALDEFRAVEGK